MSPISADATKAGVLNMTTARSKAVSKTTKHKKDGPRKPLSAYNLFFKEEKVRWLKANQKGEKDDGTPSSRFLAMTKGVSTRWKELSDEEKRPFVEDAKRETQRYRQEVEIYNQASLKEAHQQRVASLASPTVVFKKEDNQGLEARVISSLVAPVPNMMTSNQTPVVEGRSNNHHLLLLAMLRQEQARRRQRYLEHQVARLQQQALSSPVSASLLLSSMRQQPTQPTSPLPPSSSWTTSTNSTSIQMLQALQEQIRSSNGGESSFSF